MQHLSSVRQEGKGSNSAAFRSIASHTQAQKKCWLNKPHWLTL